MFFLFKGKNSQQHQRQNSQQDKIAQKIVDRCLGLQLKASSFLQNKSEMLTTKAKRMAVLSFCVLSFCSCIYIIVKSLRSHRYTSLAIAPIRVPTQNVHNQIQASISKQEFEKILKFKSYLDSLSNSKSGKRILDSINANRPGLMDSLLIVENLYQLQSPNK
jgi:hypothetical protein